MTFTKKDAKDAKELKAPGKDSRLLIKYKTSEPTGKG